MAESSFAEAGSSGASPSASLENLQVEASCSLCLGYLKEPVVVECGHNFCKACITDWWKDLEGQFPCPVCRKTFGKPSLRPNWQLGSMVEIAKQLRPGKRKTRDESLSCFQHHEPLSLFCCEDHEAVCVVCAISTTHRDHTVVPRDDAMRAYKRKLHGCLEALEQKMREIAHCRFSEEKKPRELKRRVQSRRQQISKEFEELHRRLDQEERSLLTQLEEEEQDIFHRLWENSAHLGDQCRDLSHLAAEVQDMCLQQSFQMLKDVQKTLARCEKVDTMEVASVSTELEKNFSHFPRQYFAARNILKLLSTDVTLNPHTADPHLVVSKDRKSVKFGKTRVPSQPYPPRPWPFTFSPCVLATEGFTSGRHYWEVEVGNKTQWTLGLCQDPESTRGELSPFPEKSYWRLRLSNGDQYLATTIPHTPLDIKVKPKRVGIFLDYEAGTLSFYNVTDRSLMYTFKVNFTGKLWPLFYPGPRSGRKNAAPLTIRPPTDWE